MTDAAARRCHRTLRRSRVARWLQSKDPDLLVIKRSVRAAVVMPSVFAMADRCSRTPRSPCSRPSVRSRSCSWWSSPGASAPAWLSYLGLYVVGCCFIVLGHGRLDATRWPRSWPWGLSASASSSPGIVVPPGGDGVDRCAADVRPPGRRRRTGLGDRSPPGGLDAGRRVLHHRLPGGVAASVARQPPPPSGGGGLGHRPPGRRAGAGRARSEARSGRHVRVGVACATQFSGTPYPPTGAASGRARLSKLVGRVEWVAGNTGDRR